MATKETVVVSGGFTWFWKLLLVLTFLLAVLNVLIWLGLLWAAATYVLPEWQQLQEAAQTAARRS